MKTQETTRNMKQFHLSRRYSTMFSRISSIFIISIMLIGLGGVYQTTAAVTPTVLAQGAPIHGANGIMFDSDDRLHIASVVGREIVVMDPETGEILDRLGTDLGVEGPDDLTFGPDGSLYWTSIMTGEVGRLSVDGVKTGQMVALGVNPITFSDDGRLFVALDFLGDALYELDPELVNPPRLIAENLGFLNGMDWGSDGFLYGPIWTKGQVVRVNVDTGEITSVCEGLGVPAAVKFDSQGRLHVADQMGEVSRIDIETGNREVIATGLSGLDNLAFDSHDRLFISHAQDGSIVEVLPSGKNRTVSQGGMIVPVGVAVLPRADGSESVFVADLWTLREFDALTGEALSIERHFIGVPGSITSPMTVSSDGKHLVLSSWFDNAVQVWNPETGKLLEDFRDFAVPINAIRFQGDLVVAELGTGSVVRMSAADPAERVTLVDAEGGLAVPAGLTATDDDLWVSDLATGMVLQLVADGKLLEKPIPVATGLAFPEGMAVAPDGSLLVIETGAERLLRIDLATGKVSTVAEEIKVGLPDTKGFPPMLSSVAVGPSGTIYIASDINNQLLVIRPEDFSNVFFMNLTAGLNMISLPLKPITPYTARSFAEELSATTVITLDEARQRFVGFTNDAPDDGFDIEGGKGYIVNVPEAKMVTLTGAAWTNQPPVAAAPEVRDFGYPAQTDSAWAFVVSGKLDVEHVANLFHVTVRNTRTNAVATDVVRSGYFAAAFADLTRQNVVQTGDRLEVTVKDGAGEIASETFTYTVTPETIRQAFMPITLKNIEKPRHSLLLQNYPNPFNPETWIPYQLRESALVVMHIYDAKGQLARTLDLGQRAAGFYLGRTKAAYWDGKNEAGEKVASGVYFYQLKTGDFTATRRMVIVK